MLVPHPNRESVRVVLADERRAAAVIAAGSADGPLSRAARSLLGR